MSNIVLTPHTALVNGRMTGLAGCSLVHQSQCQSAATCLRADPKLARPVYPEPAKRSMVQRCSQFIPGPIGHGAHAASKKLARPCSAHDQLAGGVCGNCLYREP
jgi:hypothetical protein